MQMRLNREIKAFCPDFSPVRQALRDIGAEFVEVKEQVDYFYHLPGSGGDAGTRRLKLRVESGEAHIIYYYDRQENEGRTSRFHIWDVGNGQVKEILDAALGIRVIVHKQRELWQMDNTIFNLDTVEGVGQIFEAEVQEQEGRDIDAQLREYWQRFDPYLGKHIEGSNEDLVDAG